MILTIPAISIARIGSGSIPVIALAIVAIVNDRNDMDTGQWSWTIKTIVIFPKVHCSSGSSHWFLFPAKEIRFWMIEWTWLDDRSAITEIDCFWMFTAIITIVTIKWWLNRMILESIIKYITVTQRFKT